MAYPRKSKEIILTPEEKYIYGQLFKIADVEEKGVIEGRYAVKFFEKSGLPANSLGDIWNIADHDNQGFLTQQSFSIAIRLIAQVQNGQLPDPAHINNDVPIPRFEGVYVKPYNKVNIPQANSDLLITNEEKEKFKRIFNSLNPINGLLDGDKVRNVFQRSNLPVETLSQIWNLSDIKKRGQLDVTEFVIAMYFVQKSMNRSIKTLPRSLQAGFYEMIAGVPVNEPTSPKFGVFGVTDSPRSELSPVMRHATLRPTSPPIFQEDTWDVSAEDKATFDRYFDLLDTTTKGFLTGEEAANFFMKSNLSPAALAQIWDLADIEKSGRLNRDEFAVGMHLITKKLVGVQLPTVLPPSLIPPSMRPSLASSSPFTEILKRSGTISSAQKSNFTPARSPSISNQYNSISDLLFDAPPTPFPSQPQSNIEYML